MMSVYVAITVVYLLLCSGSYAHRWLETQHEPWGWTSLILLALGAFGLYSLIVGK